MSILQLLPLSLESAKPLSRSFKSSAKMSRASSPTNKSMSNQNSKALINSNARRPNSKKLSKSQFTATSAMITLSFLSTPKTHSKRQLSKPKRSLKLQFLTEPRRNWDFWQVSTVKTKTIANPPTANQICKERVFNK